MTYGWNSGNTFETLSNTPWILGKAPVSLGKTPVIPGKNPVIPGKTPVIPGETPETTEQTSSKQFRQLSVPALKCPNFLKRTFEKIFLLTLDVYN